MLDDLVDLPESRPDVAAFNDEIHVELADHREVALMASRPAATPQSNGEKILVLGGTGILRPAVLALCAAGHNVIVLGRDRQRLDSLVADCAPTLGSVAAVRCDYLETEDLSKALHDSGRLRGPPASALLYCPGASSQSLSLIGRAVQGPIVLLLTSKWAEPNRPSGRAGYPSISGVPAHRMRYVLLGWKATNSTGSRWHSPAEVSKAALLALESGSDLELGVTRPWESRPR